MTGFIDTHSHFHFPDFDEDRQEVIRRAQDSGVCAFINVGTDIASSKASCELAETYDFIWASAGVHPHDAKAADSQTFAEIEKMLEHPRMVAIGEVGLDFFRDHSPQDVQIEVFRRFRDMHIKTGKPLIIHCRDAYEKLIEVLSENGKTDYLGVIHCFSSGPETMQKLVALGFHISFAGPLTYKKNDELRRACSLCPKERLLLETDAPFLPPQSMRGKRNESGYLVETARIMAELHQLSLDELASLTTQNAQELFGLCLNPS